MRKVDKGVGIEDRVSQNTVRLNDFIIESLPVGILTVDSNLRIP